MGCQGAFMPSLIAASTHYEDLLGIQFALFFPRLFPLSIYFERCLNCHSGFGRTFSRAFQRQELLSEQNMSTSIAV